MASDIADIICQQIHTANPAAFGEQVQQLEAIFRKAVAKCQSDSVLLLGPPGPGKQFLVDKAQHLVEDRRHSAELSNSNISTTHDAQFHRIDVSCHLYADAPEKCLEFMIMELLGNPLVSRNASENLEKLMQSLTAANDNHGAAQDDIDDDDFDDDNKPTTRLTAVAVRTVTRHVKELSLDEMTTDASSAAAKPSQCILLVLDGIEVLLTQACQTILYQFFDQSDDFKPPVVLVGFSDRLDLLEAMEKRLRSRFSQRQLIPACCPSSNSRMRYNVGQFLAVVERMLTIDLSSSSSSIGVSSSRSSGEYKRSAANWNNLVMNLMQSRKAMDALEKLFYIHGNNFPVIRTILEQAVVQLCDKVAAACDNDDDQSLQSSSIGLASSPVLTFCRAIDVFMEDPVIAALSQLTLTQFIVFTLAMQQTMTAPHRILTAASLAELCKNQFITTKFNSSSSESVFSATEQMLDLGLFTTTTTTTGGVSGANTVKERIPLRIAMSQHQLAEFVQDEARMASLKLPLAVEHLLLQLVRGQAVGSGGGGGGNETAAASSMRVEHLQAANTASYVQGFAVGK